MYYTIITLSYTIHVLLSIIPIDIHYHILSITIIYYPSTLLMYIIVLLLVIYHTNWSSASQSSEGRSVPAESRAGFACCRTSNSLSAIPDTNSWCPLEATNVPHPNTVTQSVQSVTLIKTTSWLSWFPSQVFVPDILNRMLNKNPSCAAIKKQELSFNQKSPLLDSTVAPNISKKYDWTILNHLSGSYSKSTVVRSLSARLTRDSSPAICASSLAKIRRSIRFLWAPKFSPFLIFSSGSFWGQDGQASKKRLPIESLVFVGPGFLHESETIKNHGGSRLWTLRKSECVPLT